MTALVTLFLLICPFFWVGMAYDAFELPKRFAFSLLLFISSSIVFIKYFLKNKNGDFFKCAISLVIFLLYVVFRTVCAGLTPNSVYHLSIWILPILSFLIAKNFRIKKDNLTILFLILFFAGLAQAILMLFQAIGLDPLFGVVTKKFEYYPARMIGTIGYQNQAAEFLVLSLCSVWIINKRYRRFIIFLSPIIVLAIFLTLNRGAIIGFVFAFLCAIFYGLKGMQKQFGFFKSAISVVCAIFLVVVFFVEDFQVRLFEIFNFSKSVAIQSRLYMWNIALNMIIDAPLFGHGAGSYAYEYLSRLSDILPMDLSHNELPYIVFAEEAHNDLLQLLAEFGVVGGILFVCVFYFIVRDLFRINKEEEDISFNQAYIFVLTFMCVCSVFSFTWQSALAGPFAGMLLGICSSYHKPADNEMNNRVSRFSSLCIVVVLSACVFFVMFNEMKYNFSVMSRNRLQQQSFFKRGKWLALDGAILATAGKYSEAECLLKDSLRDYIDIKTLSNLGNVLVRQGKYKEALQIYEKWGQTGLSYYSSLRNQILVNEKMQNHCMVADLEKRCFQLFPREYSEYDIYLMGIRFLHAERYADGYNILIKFRSRNKVLNLPGWTAEHANLLGVILLKIGKYKDASNFFLEALEINPKLESAKKNLELTKGKKKSL